MYRDIIFFNNGDMIFKQISGISIYVTSVSLTLTYLWRLTSLNKHEQCTFQNQDAARVIYMNVGLFLKGTDSSGYF
jgi:hypothetical protein